MNRLRCFAGSALLLIALSAAPAVSAQGDSPGQELIVCGWDEVFILELRDPGEPRKVWSWRANDASDLPDHVRGLFGTTDECKPIDGGRKVLITSSGGGVAVVEREKSGVTFYGRAANAHSADLLPGNRIAVAASRDPRGRGDRLVIFDLARSDQPLWSEELPSGHGAVWDAQRQILWALADEDIRAYKLRDWETPEPKLERVLAISLPEGGGHDLYPVSGTAHLTVTTTNHCWLFDRDTRTFVLHPMLAEFRHVKSISIHPVTRQLVYVQAEGENWWAERLRFLNPESSLYTRGEHHYKARWLTRWTFNADTGRAPLGNDNSRPAVSTASSRVTRDQ
jgi:hypothetical protein